MGKMILAVRFVIATATVLPTTEAVFCNAGTYFDGIKCSHCPGGMFGAVPGLTSPLCSGLCTTGFFCPEGSTSSQEKPCGTSIFYCPPGSAARRRVDEGYYTITFPTDQTNLPMIDSSQVGAKQQTRCEKGYYCVFGIRRVCPAGVFGDSTRVTSSECSGPCPKGSYCPEATSVPIPCPAGTFGSEVGLTNARCSGLCPIGSNCELGTIIPVSCPAGTYGAMQGLVSSACSSTCSAFNGVLSCLPSLCPAGYYCPLAAKAPRDCGDVSVFCPEGSSTPTAATAGYYTTWKAYTGISVTGEQLALQYVDGNPLATRNQTTRSDQHICEKGSYCNGGVKKFAQLEPMAQPKPCQRLRARHHALLASTGRETMSLLALTTNETSNELTVALVCCSPIGTTHYNLHPCTMRTSFCRQGSSMPTAVDSGYFTVATQAGLRTDETICPPGSFCVGGVQYFCPRGTYGATSGLASKTCSGKCQDGYVCTRGSTSAKQSPCQAGTYSQNGKFCAPCSPGYWCDVASPDPQQHECGADNKYCPLGSSAAQQVLDGYYAVGQQLNTHSSEALCVIRNAPHLPQCPTRTVGANGNL